MLSSTQAVPLEGIARQVSHALARAILGVSGTDDHRATNALKNLLNVLSNVVGIAIYIGHGIVAWPETMAMMTGSLLGRFVGGRSMRFLPADLFHALVVGMGAILTSCSHGDTGTHDPSQVRKRPYPPFRKRSFHLPLGPPRESLETAPIPGRSPVVPHFTEVDDTATGARDRPGRRLRPVDVGSS